MEIMRDGTRRLITLSREVVKNQHLCSSTRPSLSLSLSLLTHQFLFLLDLRVPPAFVLSSVSLNQPNFHHNILTNNCGKSCKLGVSCGSRSVHQCAGRLIW
ncbi:hypothetical protein L2E82_01366 [Cichorium intybus]|uniref:Uncharacterized protein n=1 Tax=Cichorium intybus TaxID=13427 RepID=A0ACB9GYK8_CICIN|nr:hypothetical protein L2E82_01366 [Cichorium intybus]